MGGETEPPTRFGPPGGRTRSHHSAKGLVPSLQVRRRGKADGEGEGGRREDGGRMEGNETTNEGMFQRHILFLTSLSPSLPFMWLIGIHYVL